MRFRCFSCAALIAAGAAAAAAPCAFDDAAWNAARPAERKALLLDPPLQQVSDSCVISYVRRMGAYNDFLNDSAPNVILKSRLTAWKRWNLPFLASLSRALKSEGAGVWAAVCGAWEQANGPMRPGADRLFDKGRFDEADILFTVFERAGKLDPYDYVRWSECKVILGDYEPAAQLLCAALTDGPRLSAFVQGQLQRVLRDAEPAQARRALSAFYACALNVSGTDTLALVQWLVRTASLHGFTGEQLHAVNASGLAPEIRGRLLLEIASRQFSLRRFDDVRGAASAAWTMLPDGADRRFCASMLSQACVETGRSDSALVWLDRSGRSGADARILSAVLYQDAGLLIKADSVVRSLPPGRGRDTLEVRQALLQGDTGSAWRVAAGLRDKREWQTNRLEAGLWLMRTALFARKGDRLQDILDSVTFVPSWNHAAELLKYRYRFERLKNDPQALDAWGAVEYALYTGDREKARAMIDTGGIGRDAAQLLIVLLAREHLSHGEPAQAVGLIRRLEPQTAGAEETYYCGEGLFMLGEFGEARKVLEQVIMLFPDSIYSSRARVLISRFQS